MLSASAPPNSGTLSAAPATTFEDSVALAIAPGASIELPAIVTNCSPPPTSSAAVVGSFANRRAPGDSGMESARNVSMLGPAPGCSLVWPEGFRSSACPVLHQISSSITATIKIRQQPIPKRGYLQVGFPVNGSERALPPRAHKHCSRVNPGVLAWRCCSPRHRRLLRLLLGDSFPSLRSHLHARVVR